MIEPRESSGSIQEIAEFARSHDEIVVAQWISTIDKIARKPASNKGATEAQKNLRARLGKVAWELIKSRRLLTGLADKSAADRLELIWNTKIAPYGSIPYKTSYRNGKPLPEPSPKGRLYRVFVGDTEPERMDAGMVAQRIYRHLYEAEQRPRGCERAPGLIEARAQSIAVNVLKPAGKDEDWNDRDAEVYRKAGDVAAAIRTAAIRRERGEDNTGTRRVGNSVAGAVLYEHWGKLFAARDGEVLGIADARQRSSGLVALHMAIKDFYVRRLKDHNKKPPRTIKGRDGKTVRQHGNVIHSLPANWAALLRQIENGRRNRDLNALVRLGKVIHYQASDGRPDTTSSVVDGWPTNIAKSRYWSSDGQAEIKRNEAFVRVWRRVLALASATLRDWADPEHTKLQAHEDVLGKREFLTEHPQFSSEEFARKRDLLFGKEAFRFTGSRDLERSVLGAAIEACRQLRNKTFHFAGKGAFLNALHGLSSAAGVGEPGVHAALHGLLEADVAGRSARLRATMVGCHLGDYYNDQQNHGLYEAVGGAGAGRLPLPRLSRLLQRAEDTWSSDHTRLLPPAANRVDLENPSRLAAYSALKLVYEKPFRTWLESRDTATLNGFINRAVERGTQAAQDINAREDDPGRKLIRARAAQLGILAHGETLSDFLDGLAAATATEMRVQNAYESDGDKAREQAGFIEQFKCEVFALAFRAYLEEADFAFLLQPEPAALPVPFDPATLPDLPVDASARPDWQAVLYFALHLVPVDDIGALLHQLRKWAILVNKGGGEQSIDPVLEVLELYLDMHDAKFEGGAALVGTDPFRPLFETDTAFDAMFPEQTPAQETRVPRRGLREIMRFGHLQPLRQLFGSQSIAEADVESWFAAAAPDAEGRSSVARRQARREALHATWAKDTKRGLDPDDKRAYVEAVAETARHRRLAARVTLTNHVRLHRLLMGVMGRLVDFAGLWERDLYFATLGAMHEQGETPRSALGANGVGLLSDGRILAALGKVKQTTVLRRLEPHFGDVWKPGNAERQIRNDLAHLNMLRTDIDLTKAVNQTRALLRHDRKLANAVPGAVIDLLAREGLVLSWVMNAQLQPHCLERATLTSRRIVHLGGAKLFEHGEAEHRNAGRRIEEDMHGGDFVAMAAGLFKGSARAGRPDVVDLEPSRIDWRRTRVEPKFAASTRRKNRGKGRR